METRDEAMKILFKYHHTSEVLSVDYEVFKASIAEGRIIPCVS